MDRMSRVAAGVAVAALAGLMPISSRADDAPTYQSAYFPEARPTSEPKRVSVVTVPPAIVTPITRSVPVAAAQPKADPIVLTVGGEMPSAQAAASPQSNAAPIAAPAKKALPIAPLVSNLAPLLQQPTATASPQGPAPGQNGYASGQAGGSGGAGSGEGMSGTGTGDGTGVGGAGDAGGFGDTGAIGGAGAGTAGGGGVPGVGTGDTGAGFAGVGGGAAGGGDSGAPPGVIGDMSPVRIFAAPGGTELPPVKNPNNPPNIKNFNAAVRGFKIAENQSPRPIDRVFASFNFYDNINRSYDQRVGAPVSHIRAYREIFGFEKTFLDGRGSFGLREPVNTIVVDSNVAGYGGTHSSLGDLNLFGKYVIAANKDMSSLVSAGLNLTLPTGPRGFGGYNNIAGFRNTQIQPFIGYLWTKNKFYVQGFFAVDVPTDPNDSTLMFNDVAFGYYLYQAKKKDAFLTAIVPTFETHVNTPMNHRGFHANDPAATPDIVNLTFGTTFVVKRNTFITLAYITPVTGPKPFDYEIAALLNIRFGGKGGVGGFGRNAPPVVIR